MARGTTTKTHINRLLVESRHNSGAARFFLSALGERVMRDKGKSEHDSLRRVLRKARDAATDSEEAVTCIEDRMRERNVYFEES